MGSPLNSGQVRIAGTGAFMKGPIGATLPTDAVSSWGSSFVNLGYSIAPDGFSVKQDYKTKQIDAWQTLEPVRTFGQSLTRDFSFELLQTNKDTLSLAFGGATYNYTGSAVGGAVTIGANGALTTATAHGFSVGDPIFLSGIATATGILNATTYFVITVGSSTTLVLSSTKGGVALTNTAGTATSIASAASFSLSLPAADVVNEFVLGFDWSDGPNSQWRFILPRATLLSLPTIKYGRGDAVSYPMEVRAVKPADGTDSVIIYAKDPSAAGS